MKLEFYSRLDLTNINDSMELDSGQTVCQLKIKNDSDGSDKESEKKPDVIITIEVQGHVKVFYKDGMYKCASQMPDELLEIFHKGYEDPEAIGLNVCENNWFEIYIEDGGQCVLSDVVCPEGMNEIEQIALMLDVYKDYLKDYKQSCEENQIPQDDENTPATQSGS